MIAIAGGLLAAGAGLVAVDGPAGTAPLWYVVVVGGCLGAVGTAAYGRKAGPPPTA